MPDFVDPAWRDRLDRAGLADFDALWNLQAAWFEPPNQRRGGWSGVARVELAPGQSDPQAIFLKRQENHKTFSWRHPWRGIPTFQREFHHLMHYRACAVPTLEPVYYGARWTGQGHRAILATAELAGFTPLEQLLRPWQDMTLPPPQRRGIIEAIANLARVMHEHRIQHNCFYPKHLFVRVAADQRVEARVIDLEKSRWRPVRRQCTLRDLDTLNRHAVGISRTDRLRFLKAYLQTGRTTAEVKSLWRRLANKVASKRRQRA